MLVLSRFPGESIDINGEYLLTVIVTGQEFVELRLMTSGGKPIRLITVGMNDRAMVTNDISVVLIQVKNGKARLGIDYPKMITIRRIGADDDE